MDMDLIVRYNEWWRTGTVPARLLDPSWRSRPALQEIIRHLGSRRALVLSGLRRIGKSVLLLQTVQDLLGRGHAPNRVLYLSFDRPGASLEEAMANYERAILRQPLAEGASIVVFLDEVQKLPKWADRVKVYRDLYPDIKFILSGSATLPLLLQAGDSLAGRADFLDLTSCPFREFLAFRDKGLSLPAPCDIRSVRVDDWLGLADQYAPWGPELAASFEEYLWRGGFPEIASEGDPGEAYRYVQSSVVARVVHQDIPLVFPVRRTDVLVQLTRFVTERPGDLIRIDSLASTLGVDRHTVAQYLAHLEQSCLLRMLWNSSGTLAAATRKHRRAYPSDVSMVTGGSWPMSSVERGRRVETALIQHLHATHFWRMNDQYETDVVMPLPGQRWLAVEVKNSSRVDNRDLRGLRRFAATHPGSELLVVHNGPASTLLDEPRVVAVPAWLFLSATFGQSHAWHTA